jgi:tetratricopeptide (TPR) repeat protein
LSGVVVLSLAVEASLAVAQTAGPKASDLPRLTFEAVPPSVRGGVEDAYNAARAKPHDASTVGRLGMILHAYDQYDSARLCYRRARQLDPRAMSWTYLSAVVDAALGQNLVAAAGFRRALAIEPGYLPARLRLADALMAGGDLEGSHVELQALVRDFPDLALAHYGLGRLLSNQGRAAAATEHYERAVELEPQFGPAHYALALAYRDAGASDRAQAQLDAYRRLGARRPVPADRLLDEIKSMKGTGRDLLADGARLGREGRLTESIAMHLRAIEADPADAQAHVNLISLYGRTGEPKRAEEHYRAAVALGTSLPEAHYNYGVLLSASGRYDEAAAAFRKTLDINPFHPQATNNLATLLARQGKVDEAAVRFRQAIANDPQYRAARFNLGRLLVGTGRPLEAVEQFRRLLEPEDVEDDDTPRYMFALANAYLTAGEVPHAAEYGERALRRAQKRGQSDLAATIQQWLRRLRVPLQ